MCVLAKANADILNVTSFMMETQDISARTKPRTDMNGKDCALIKIQSTEDDLIFEGDIVGDIIQGTSEYWVYLSELSTFLVVKSKHTEPLTIIFADYPEVMSLKSKCTYVLKLQIEKLDYKISYKEEYDGIIGGHKYIDLGLSVCWATSNIGTTTPNELGKLFAWGEINSKKNFDLSSYKYYISGDRNLGEFTVLSKYNISSEEDFVKLELMDDAASVQWKDKWRIPTGEELVELFSECTFMEYKYNNTDGYVITGPNGKTIFLPVAPKAAFGNNPEVYPIYNVDQSNSEGHMDSFVYNYNNGYWSSYGGETDYDPWAMCLVVTPSKYEITTADRYIGCLIRPVIKVNNK